MKKIEMFFREILYHAIEKKNSVLTQAELSRNLHISLGAINSAVKFFEKIGALEIKPRNFHIIDIKKILYHWASTRNIHKDIVFATRVELPVRDIEKLMPDTIVFGAYSAYKFLFNDVPADYSEVYVYGDEELKTRFPLHEGMPNLFVLRKDALIKRYGKTTTIAQTFVDLWNLKEWYAKEFVNALEARLHGILE